MSDRTNRAAERVAEALATVDDIRAGKREWHAVGLLIGHLIAASNELIEAVEDLEKKVDELTA